MRRSWLLIGLAAMLVGGCSQTTVTPQQRAVIGQVLQDRLTAWARVFNNKDRDSLAMFYDQSPQLTVAWPDGNRTRGWTDESQAEANFFTAAARVNLVVQDAAVDVLAPNVATTTFRLSMDIVYSTTARDIYSGQGTLVWIKGKDGQWRIHDQHLSQTPGGTSSPGVR